ncbi:MAG: ketopantoate reductase PanG [Bacteroidetes bacterium HLUCCA01]|nr:MAG: ketopantoate reductase PanG [Bacteroidetes bacterium HLUCCA01]
MDVHIIGAGRLGITLARAIQLNEDYRLKTIVSSRADQFNEAFPEVDLVSRIATVPFFNGLVFLCVPDDQISVTASQLCTHHFEPDTVVAHVSGALASGELHVLKKSGWHTASFHPMQTFTQGANPALFTDTLISIEGDAVAVNKLFPLATALGGKPRQVDEQSKLALHAAGVMISNFMSALFLNANDLIQTYVQDDEHNFAIEYYKGIARNTLENIITQGLPDAITGPAARGDLKTVHRHLGILKDPEAIAFYKLMTRRLAREFHNDEHAIFRL